MSTDRRHVEHVMGTVFSFDIRAGATPRRQVGDALRAAVDWLHQVDATFSTYREDSAISRLRYGRLTAAEFTPQIAEVLDLCARARERTDGFFDALYCGWIDPTGLVKGWSIEKAGAILTAHGLTSYSINGGGDIRTAGSPEPGVPWRIGVTDPLRPGTLLDTVTGHDLAVATSGTAERGRHIVDPRYGRAAGDVLSATVVGPDLALADAYATALVAAGTDRMSWFADLAGYTATVLSADGDLHRSTPRS